MNRDEIVKAFNDADVRIERLRARAVAAPETRLLDGEWRVRDALSHAAARANSMPLVRRWVAASQAGEERAQTTDIHETNAGQVRDRAASSVDELLDEMRAGHAAALAEVAEVDDAFLEQTFKVGFRPEPIMAGRFVVLAGPGHEGNHLADVEKALGIEAS